MSDITPISYLDDGVSFSRRLPPATSLVNVSRWLHSASSEVTSAYTGSYIDDGADMLPPTAPGFGKIDARFYRQKKRRSGDAKGTWNDSIAQAVGGDIQRSLAEMRGIATLEVKRVERSEKEEKERRQRKRGTVSVPAPLKWGTFIIRGDDGRVIVVEENGEYDSGPVKAVEEKARDGEKEGKRWIKAASTATPPPSVRHRNKSDSLSIRTGKNGKPKSHVSQLRTPASKPNSLAPIPESDYNYDYDYDYKSNDTVVIPPAASPTNFFMTGGLSGWPSPAPSPAAPCAIVPHAITWDTASPPQASTTQSKVTSASSVRAPRSTWPLISSCRSMSSAQSSTISPSLKQRRSNKNSKGSRHSSHRVTEQDSDDMSSETRLPYKLPTIIEVTYDETPPGEVSDSRANWEEEDATISQAWSYRHKNKTSDAEDWSGSVQGASTRRFSHASAVDDVKTPVCDERQAGSKRAWDLNEQRTNYDTGDENGWDGFERPKTMSEISVAGSGNESERSWPPSEHSRHSRHSRHSHHSHYNRRSQNTNRAHRSHRSSRHSRTSWDDSQASSKPNSAVQWGDSWSNSKSKRSSEKGWAGSPSRSERSTTEHQDDFNEPNKTYLNETWGEIPVRVASRRTSVARWD